MSGFTIEEIFNLTKTDRWFLTQIKEIVGLEEEAPQTIYKLEAKMPLAIVLGGEGQGLHRLVRERCDFLYKIPMAGKLASLNVATAAAVVCYEVIRQRTFIP